MGSGVAGSGQVTHGGERKELAWHQEEMVPGNRSALPAALPGSATWESPRTAQCLHCQLLGLALSSQFFPWPPSIQSGLLKYHRLRRALPDRLI